MSKVIASSVFSVANPETKDFALLSPNILFEININSVYFFISSDFFQEQNKADPDAIVPHNPSPDSQNNIFQ